MRRVLPLLLLLIALVAWFGLSPAPALVASAPMAGATAAREATGSTPLASPGRQTGAIADDLPPEAHDTLRLIAAGGPFPYDRDGVVFGNYEHRLPEHPRGYYHEYTVVTPGAGNRGARRIIVGGDPPEVYFYTDDHYETFRPIEASP